MRGGRIARRTIDAELAAYGAGLDARPQVVVLNKSDLRADAAPFTVEDPRIVRVLRVSAATGAGIDGLKRSLFRLVPDEEVEPAADDAELVDYLVYRPQPTRRAYRVFRTDRGFRVTGKPPAKRVVPEMLHPCVRRFARRSSRSNGRS